MANQNPGDFGGNPNSMRPANSTAGHGAAPFDYGGAMRPAAPPPHAGQGSMQAMDSADGLGQILARQWHVIALTTIAAMMLSVLYLLVTKTTYTSISTLRVAPLDPNSISTSNSANQMQDESDFLDTECITIKSSAVLALAMDKIRQTRTLRGMAHPMEYLRTHVQADPAKKGIAIDVSFKSPYPEDANQIVDSVVQAYKDYASQAWKSRADEYLQTLVQGSRGREDELVKTQQQLRDLAIANGFTPDTDPEKSPQHMAVLSLRDALEKARLETLRAQNAYAQASKAIIGHPDLVHAVDLAEQQNAPAINPEDELKKYDDELTLEQTQLNDQLGRLGPRHPMVATAQARVDEMIVAKAVAAKQWEESTQASQEAIENSLKGAEKSELDIADAQRQYIQLRADEDRLKKEGAAVDERLHEIDSTKSAGAINIQVLDEAEISLDDTEPAKIKTLGISLVLGLIAGIGAACARDWTDDRMRTAQAVKAAAGAPILGAIPPITTAYTAADRAQIVHHEPFGIPAESYRTLRTGLQYGLPAGTRTMLVTSPVSGDGKSTFVSNLAIALAQASKRVLIVDADFRAPMQHRLFGLKDRVGLASVLCGGDAIEQAIQRTEIEGLDVLPCGPTPSNPAELLNSPTFTDLLNNLADKYDMVLLDSPPVTAVADARILAVSADVSVMVIHLESSTRKQTETARDGLRSVGARLVGVAVNGVARAAQFGGASGYYQTGSNATPGFDRPARRPSGFGETEAVGDPSGRA